ncbi:hypothetical protein JNUCC42_21950 [Brevibacterium sp. JNUCC-42]|nr:hypothetical protein JNUCC42_21950 [Brevibacterium sp. JNUCC-42]
MKIKITRRKIVGMIYAACMTNVLVLTPAWAHTDMVKPSVPFTKTTSKSGEKSAPNALKQQNPQKALPKEWRERIDHLITSYEPWSQYQIVEGKFRREESREYWDVQLVSGTDEKLSLTINGKNGNLLRALSTNEKRKPIHSPSEGEAVKQATVFLESMLGKDANEYQLASNVPYSLPVSQASIGFDSALQGTRVIKYQRLINKIPSELDAIRIAVDEEGKIKSFVRDEIPKKIVPTPSVKP